MSTEDKRRALQENLQKAVELEMTTIPPYLTALYSIVPGQNAEAAKIIRSVFMEEMLHIVLVANILSAIGCRVELGEQNIPVYPCQLEFRGAAFKNREFDVDLAAFSPETIEIFRKIELPEFAAEPEAMKAIVIPGYTIGEFYNLIKNDLKKLCEEFGEESVFTGNPDFQVSRQYYWSGGGAPVVVTNLKEALRALDIVIQQGEGTSESLSDGDGNFFQQAEEIPHYYRFTEISKQRRYKADDKPDAEPSGDELKIDYTQVYPIKTNCKRTDFLSDPQLLGLNDEFNNHYSLMLTQLAEGFNGNPRNFYTAIMNGMHSLTPIALKMVQIPISGNLEGKHGAPSFEWFLKQI